MSAVSDSLLEQFLAACGADGPLQLDVALGGDPAERRSLSQPFAVVGRDPDVDLPIDHPLISRRHAYLQVIAGRVFCMDLGSRTGTHWGTGSDRAGWLNGGQILQVGPALIRPANGTWEFHPATDERVTDEPGPLASRDPEHDPLPAVTLEFPRNSRVGEVCYFDRVLMLAGRAPECRLRLGDPEVSKLHCSLLRTPGGVWVVDLFGRGGIRVNGARVRYARLDDGDQLQLGRHLICVRYGIHDGPPRALPKPRPGSSRSIAVAGWHPASPELSRLVAGRSSDQAELVGALLGPLLSEFGALQQQMAEMQQRRADEFQQALMTMFQMFGAMHRDQMNLIREEMDRINELAQEQRALESKLAGQSPNLAEPAPPVGETPRPEPRSREPNPNPNPSRPSQPGPVAAPAPGETELARPAPSTTSPEQAPRPTGTPADENMHAWLSQRIASIREERQGRWQKLLRSLMGRVSGDFLP
jgi:pSer/pThr/pTyr-binding forkhead associated (FHA) protein